MSVSAGSLAEAIVQVYTRQGSALMQPTFGVLVRAHGALWAVTAGHTVDDRSAVEVWTGVHPDVADGLGYGTAAEVVARLAVGPATGAYVLDVEADLLAIPIGKRAGSAFDLPADLAEPRLGAPALIVFEDYGPDEDQTMRKYQDGVAGPVPRVGPTAAVVSVPGSEGMSGSPVVTMDERGRAHLLGLYTGTPPTTPLTREAVRGFAMVARLTEGFLCRLTQPCGVRGPSCVPTRPRPARQAEAGRASA